MKTTLEMPDAFFCRVKATAARNGQSLKEFVIGALRDRLANGCGKSRGRPAGFGKVPARYVREVQAVVDEEFSRIDSADWG